MSRKKNGGHHMGWSQYATIVGLIFSLLTAGYSGGVLSTRVDTMNLAQNELKSDIKDLKTEQKAVAVVERDLAVMKEQLTTLNKTLGELKSVIENWSRK